MAKRLGIIQSRGLGDIIIALPIAGHYRDQGWTIYWPIAEQFIPSMTLAAPWVKWIPLTADRGAYFYDTPKQRLKNLNCDEIICLYQALSSMPELTARPEFQILKFDQIKYSEAGLPFTLKWTLADYVTRYEHREQALKDKLNHDPTRPHCVLHLDGSDHRAEFDRSIIPNTWQVYEVAPLTESIFDWLGLLTTAECIVCVDSVIANLVDQFMICETVCSYFIPRSHIQLTPVMRGPWHYLEPSGDTANRIRIFRS